MQQYQTHNEEIGQLRIGEKTVDCRLLYQQLGTEVEALDKRINQLQQSCQPDLAQLEHLGTVLKNRQTILSWLSIRELINQ
jgi:hypothetical protein